MLVLNEGVPRSGKSYDAVKSHLLPALKKGRRVYARLNGLRHDHIASYLGVSEASIRELLVLVETKDVRFTFACMQDETGKWCIPDHLKDVLVVIDEVHEFYINERRPLPPEIENFWALLGQNGGDAVIMTQWINRVHSAVRARIEKKQVFQKLSALSLKNRYRVTYYQTLAPGKFEKIGGQTLKYDPAIFPLYHGYAPGADNIAVYESGGRTVWRAIAFKVGVGVVLFVWGGFMFMRFFSPAKKLNASLVQTTSQQPSVVGRVMQPGETLPPAGQLTPQGASKETTVPYSELTSEQRYIMGISDKARIRLAMIAQIGGVDHGWVEWVDTSNSVIETLDLKQLSALGFDVSVHTYGVRLAAKQYVLVATAWPREVPIRDHDARLYDTSGGIRRSSQSTGGAGVVSIANDARATGGLPR